MALSCNALAPELAEDRPLVARVVEVMIFMISGALAPDVGTIFYQELMARRPDLLTNCPVSNQVNLFLLLSSTKARKKFYPHLMLFAFNRHRLNAPMMRGPPGA